MGIVSQRYILRMPVLKDADTDDILRLITPFTYAPPPRRRQVASRDREDEAASVSRSVGGE